VSARSGVARSCPHEKTFVRPALARFSALAYSEHHLLVFNQQLCVDVSFADKGGEIHRHAQDSLRDAAMAGDQFMHVHFRLEELDARVSDADELRLARLTKGRSNAQSERVILSTRDRCGRRVNDSEAAEASYCAGSHPRADLPRPDFKRAGPLILWRRAPPSANATAALATESPCACQLSRRNGQTSIWPFRRVTMILQSYYWTTIS